MYNCLECNRNDFEHHNALTNHLKIHKMNSREYYDQFLKKPNEDICICGKLKKYQNFKVGYQKFCSTRCSNQVNVQEMWNRNPERKKIQAARMVGNHYGTGKPKGSKNKNPYPITEAVLKRYRDNKPPSWKGKTHSEETKRKMSISRSAYIEEFGITMAYKGKFVPSNPQKYNGDVANIVWRSTWELKVFNWCDTNPSIMQWASEEISIPYISPVDNKIHRYYPDVWMLIKQSDGTIVKRLIEIKPQYQTVPPKLQKKITPKYITEVKTYAVNDAKWKAAKVFCDEHNMKFDLLTEKDLFGKEAIQ